MPDKDNETTVNVGQIPVATLEFVRPFARKDARSDSDASTLRYALVELEKRLRAEEYAAYMKDIPMPKKEPTDA